MKVTYFAAATAALLAIGIAACDRNAPNTPSSSTDLEKLPGQVERQIEKAGAVVDDASITAKVKAALVAEPGIEGFGVDVDTSANVVTLSGTVASSELREEAQRIARKVDGVKEVKNNLTVKPAP